MTIHRFKPFLAALVLVASVGVAHADTGVSAEYAEPNFHDVVRDANGNVVRSSNGECVRTQWLNTYDACAPTPPAPPPAPVVQQVISQEERTVYFPFNKATLTPGAKHKLDTLAKDIRSYGNTKGARIVGFADRMGSATYNEKLSKKRAETVRKYLAQKGVINASLAETRWFGDTMPATNCSKDLTRAKKIDCLQKDRRVEVEVDYATPQPVITR